LFLEADEGALDVNGQRISFQGHAVVRLPAGPPAWLFRFPSGRVLVMPEPATVACDQLAFADGVVAVRGHVRMKRDFTIFQADEAEFHLRSTEADIRGNNLIDGVSPGPTPTRTRDRQSNFPPEIVK
jgi:hypothetical protein